MALPTSLPTSENLRSRKPVVKNNTTEKSSSNKKSNILPDGWTVDSRTGIKHRILEPSLFNDSGSGGYSAAELMKGAGGRDSVVNTANPKLQVEDIGGFSGAAMDKSASEFLSHLRVPVSKEELDEARREWADKQIAESELEED
jgi:hypothetical protein